MDFGLKGKIAFVGASSKGLGKAVAIELASEGVQVIINGRDITSLNETKQEIDKQYDVNIHIEQGDLSNALERYTIIENVLAKYGSIDILVTNTGGPPSGTFERFSKSDWDNAYELLLGSAITLINAFLPGMKKKRWGRILTISSMAVKQPVNNLILSNSVRASIVGLVKSLSNEVGKDGVTVNNIMPGYTDTERLRNLNAANPSFHKVIESVPLGRIGKPKEFAAAVVFLASERASYITGVSLAVDGGAIKALM